MFFLTKIISLALVISGCIFMLRPEVMKKIFDYVKEGNKIYWVGVARFFIGWVLIAAYSQSRVGWIVLLLGIVALASGILVFVIKKEKVIEVGEKLLLGGSPTSNVIATIPLLLGVLLFCAL